MADARGSLYRINRALLFSVLSVGLGFYGTSLRAQSNESLSNVVRSVVSAEREASSQRPPFLYTSIETSDRTKGHVWTERVADIWEGRLRYLIAEDGHPLSASRRAEEIARIRSIAADPSSLRNSRQEQQSDENRARQMIDLLPRAFVFEDGGREGDWVRINYKPNPNYVPQTFEERALHGMKGTLIADSRSRRLHQLSGALDDDVSFGYGLLGTIHRGTNFTTTRDLVGPNVWKTTVLDVKIDGRIAFFKTIGRRQHSIHRDFQALPLDISLPQAVALLLQ
ncbi:hypothetical protein [Tunturibacter empetritectus]|uniref:Uncharacterized protein n=1 Tax=Tunturiibacter empetritectus TaxID=3069691 RepID=A0A7W8MT06_9BACT|nr:hypothetical protein [Edaphobacter lichenicola]MBB5319228.1 hypothetical protein [Edaphobacter lichenicola]